MPFWIKGWVNFVSSYVIASGNAVLFLVMLHQSCSEETLWLTAAQSLGTCSRNASAKCLATEFLLPSANCLLFARWGTAVEGKHFMNHNSHDTNSQPKYFHPYSHQIPPLLENLFHPVGCCA